MDIAPPTLASWSLKQQWQIKWSNTIAYCHKTFHWQATKLLISAGTTFTWMKKHHPELEPLTQLRHSCPRSTTSLRCWDYVLSISTFQNPKSGASSPQFQHLFHLPEKNNAEPCFWTFPSSDDVAVDTSGLTCTAADTEGVEISADLTGQLWILCRAAFNSNWTVPDWSWWLSQTCEQKDAVIPPRIGYMKTILHPVTDFATVKKCLTISMEVTQKLNQEYTLVTMDLAAAKIAYDVNWRVVREGDCKFRTISHNVFIHGRNWKADDRKRFRRHCGWSQTVCQWFIWASDVWKTLQPICACPSTNVGYTGKNAADVIKQQCGVRSRTRQSFSSRQSCIAANSREPPKRRRQWNMLDVSDGVRQVQSSSEAWEIRKKRHSFGYSIATAYGSYWYISEL